VTAPGPSGSIYARCVRGPLRALVRLAVSAGVTALAVAAVRGVLGRLAGEPGRAGRFGSFDAWPTVPPAPGRPAPNGTATSDAADRS